MSWGNWKIQNSQFSIFQIRLQSERFNILNNLVRLHFTIPPLRHKRCYELQANDRILRLRQEMLIWSMYMCNLLWGRTQAKVKVTTQQISKRRLMKFSGEKPSSSSWPKLMKVVQFLVKNSKEICICLDFLDKLETTPLRVVVSYAYLVFSQPVFTSDYVNTETILNFFNVN